MQIKNHLLFGAFLLLLLATACKPKEFVEATGAGPTIKISSEFEKIQGINVGDKVTIPVNVTSDKGIKRLAYFFVNNTANGIESGTPVYSDNESFPKELNQDIEFTILPEMAELVLISFDKENRSTELHIPMSEIRKLPILTFKDNIKYRETAFFEKHLHIIGNVTSESDLKTITYQMIVDGNVSAENNVAIADKNDTPFDIDIIVPRGLQAVVVTATNIYDGFARDTFKIGGVADDAINLTLSGGITSIDMIYADSVNNIEGSIQSGSEVTSLTYAVKINGTYGTETPITLGTPLNNFSFNIPLIGAPGMEAVRISGLNEGGMEQQVELGIAKVTQKLLYFKDVVLTTEVGPGKNIWFSAYKAPHVFDVASAAPNSSMMDFVFFVNTSTTYRFGPAHLAVPGSGYEAKIAPYVNGFTSYPYLMVPSTRNQVTFDAMASVNWDHELKTFIDTRVFPSYNVYEASRRVSDNVTRAGQGYVFAWGEFGPIIADNKGFMLVIVKNVVVSGGHATVTLDIKAPATNYRALYP